MSYQEWFDFNKAQTSHRALLDNIVPYSFLMLVAGVRYPWGSTYCGVAYLIAKFLTDCMSSGRGIVVGAPKAIAFLLTYGSIIGLGYMSVKTCLNV